MNLSQADIAKLKSMGATIGDPASLAVKPKITGELAELVRNPPLPFFEVLKRASKTRSSTASLLWQLRSQGIKRSQYKREHRFCSRKWRFDLCFPQWGVAVEIQGLDSQRRGHQSISGFKSDCEKFSTAFAMGWTVVPVLHEMIADGSALDCIISGLKTRGEIK